MNKKSVVSHASEHDEQCHLFEWWNIACMGLGVPRECLFAIPNSGVEFGAGGGIRGKVLGHYMKKEGRLAGVPDIFLAYPNENKHGLFIEMKREKGGVVSDNQKKMIELLKQCGYEAVVCHGFVDAVNNINGYLKTGVSNG